MFQFKIDDQRHPTAARAMDFLIRWMGRLSMVGFVCLIAFVIYLVAIIVLAVAKIHVPQLFWMLGEAILIAMAGALILLIVDAVALAAISLICFSRFGFQFSLKELMVMTLWIALCCSLVSVIDSWMAILPIMGLVLPPSFILIRLFDDSPSKKANEKAIPPQTHSSSDSSA